MLSKQNEVVARMIDRSSVGGGNGQKPITSGDPLLATGELKDAIGGTPKIVRKTAGRRGNSQSRVIEREMQLAPQQSQGSRMGNTIL